MKPLTELAHQANHALDRIGNRIIWTRQWNNKKGGGDTTGNRSTTDLDIGEYSNPVLGHCTVNVDPVSTFGAKLADVVKTL